MGRVGYAHLPDGCSGWTWVIGHEGRLGYAATSWTIALLDIAPAPPTAVIWSHNGSASRCAELDQPFFFRFLGFLGFGAGSSRVVILTSSLSHSPSSIWPSINKLILAPG